MTLDKICGICRIGYDEHRVAEREGATHHKFSEEGLLEPVASKGPTRQAPGQQQPFSANPVDGVLRYILISQGIVTLAQLTEAEQLLSATGMLMTPPVANDAAGN